MKYLLVILLFGCGYRATKEINVYETDYDFPKVNYVVFNEVWVYKNMEPITAIGIKKRVCSLKDLDSIKKVAEDENALWKNIADSLIKLK